LVTSLFIAVDLQVVVVFEVRSNKAHSRDKAKVQIKPEDWQHGCCQSRCKYRDVLSLTVFWFCNWGLCFLAPWANGGYTNQW